MNYMSLDNIVDPVTGNKLLKGQVISEYELLSEYRGLKSSCFKIISDGIFLSRIPILNDTDSGGFERLYNRRFTF